ncbi:MAG: hypothetical protein ACJAVR_002905 [Paracoccaceae bacterium]|jgi:hypothetical protein
MNGSISTSSSLSAIEGNRLPIAWQGTEMREKGPAGSSRFRHTVAMGLQKNHSKMDISRVAPRPEIECRHINSMTDPQ